GAQFRCHQWVLARWSPFFEALFSRAFAESRHARAKLENVDGEALEGILSYFLHGRFTVSADNCLRLLFAVEYLLLENLADFVTSFIEENLQDVLKSEEFSRLELEQLWKLVPAIARGCCLDKELGLETVVLYLQCWKLGQPGSKQPGICDDVRALINELENSLERLRRAPETAYAIYKHSPNCVTKLFEDQKQPTKQSGSLNDLYRPNRELGSPPAKIPTGHLMRAHSTNELLSSQEEWMFQLRSLISEGTTLMRQLSNQELQLPHDIPHECIRYLAVLPSRYALVLTDSRRLHLCPWNNNRRGASQLVEAQCDSLLQCGRDIYAVLQQHHVALWNCQLKMFELVYSLSEHIIHDISWYRSHRTGATLALLIAHRAFPCNLELLCLDFDQVVGQFKQPPVRFHPALANCKLFNPRLIALSERVLILYEQGDADKVVNQLRPTELSKRNIATTITRKWHKYEMTFRSHKVFVVTIGAQGCKKVRCKLGISNSLYLNDQLFFYTADNSMLYKIRYDFKDFDCEECGELARLNAVCVAPTLR
ncbi:hypothetical protein BIW11_07300, partial [Tropilaelaps mercedesae]